MEKTDVRDDAFYIERLYIGQRVIRLEGELQTYPTPPSEGDRSDSPDSSCLELAQNWMF